MTSPTNYNGLTNDCCALVELAMEGIDATANKSQPLGIYEAVKFSTEQSSVEVIIDSEKDRPATGSFRKVYTKGVLPDCNTDSTPRLLCDIPTVGTTTDSPTAYLEHTVEQSITRTITMDLTDFKKFCENPQEYLSKIINSYRLGVQQEINKKTLERLLVYMGQYKAQIGTADNSLSVPEQVNLFNDLSQGYSGYALIKDQYAQLGHTAGEPIVIGGTHVSTSLNSASRGVGYNQAGYAPDMLPNGFVDYSINPLFNDGQDHAITFMPGTFIYVNYNDINKNIVELNNSDRIRKVTKSPFGDSFKWDFYFDVDPSGCKYQITWQTWIDVLCPQVYNDCISKPALHYLLGCTPNPCPTN